MGTKNLFGTLLLFFCTIGFISCDEADDGSRGFMSEATIIGDPTNGYYCYLDGGGLVVSHDPGLAGMERGYFEIRYMETDWSTAADSMMYINNAHIYPYTIYNVIRPISLEDAENQHITDKDSCFIPPLLSIEYGYRGYFDLSTGISVVNLTDGEKTLAKLSIAFDRTEQTPDTLRLRLYYNPNIPDTWSKPSYDYGSVSCDISSLATLEQWSDSITIVLEERDENEHWTRISKNDFFKPEIKIK